jgi:hypothetical protein
VESLKDFTRDVGGDCDEQDSEDDEDLSPMMVGNSSKMGLHPEPQAPVSVALSEATPRIPNMAVVAPLTTVYAGCVDGSYEKQHKRDDSPGAQHFIPTRPSFMGVPPKTGSPFQPPLIPHVLLGIDADSSRPVPPSDFALVSRDTNAHEDPGMSRQAPAGPRAHHCMASVPAMSFGFHFTTTTPPV